MDFEDKHTWLRDRVLRLPTILRYVKDPKVESGLRELIAKLKSALSNWRRGNGQDRAFLVFSSPTLPQLRNHHVVAGSDSKGRGLLQLLPKRR